MNPPKIAHIVPEATPAAPRFSSRWWRWWAVGFWSVTIFAAVVSCVVLLGMPTDKPAETLRWIARMNCLVAFVFLFAVIARACEGLSRLEE